MSMHIKDIIRWLHIALIRHHATSCLSKLPLTGTTLIVAPHPDDEVIGCGGLIARLMKEGRAPHIVVMTGGEGSHRGCCNTPESDVIKARRRLTRKAMSILGIPEQNIHELDFTDGKINNDAPQMAQLTAIINSLNPQSVFVPHWGEGWPDHVRTAEIVKDIVPDSTDVWEYCVWMWYYNVWRGLDWRNAAVLRMTPKEHGLKLRAMDAYIKPLAPCGRPWSGVLPPLFIKANRWDKELYFKVVK